MLNVGYGTYKDRSDESINMSFKVRLRDCRVLTDVKTAVVSAKQGRKPNINLEDKGKQCPHTNTHSQAITTVLPASAFLNVTGDSVLS